MNEYDNNNMYYSQPQYNPNQQYAQGSIPVQPQSVPVAPQKKNNFFPKLLGAIALGLTFGVCGALGFYTVNTVTGKLSTTSTLAQTGTNTEIASLQNEINDLQKTLANLGVTTSASISDDSAATNTSTTTINTNTATDVTAVVDKVMPAMVSITNLYEETTNYWGRTYTQEAQSSGSGIIIGENDNEYLIVTNYHVIEKCVQLTAQFVDSTEAACSVKGYDESMDIAVICVQKSALSSETRNSIKIAEMGDSDALKIGEPAIAIGNALGYGQSVTTGVISALNRDLEMENSYDSLIQTSAAINPGNSGGALLNISGQVVGINSSKIGGSTIEGMGYAIPVNAVKDLIEEFSNRETLYKVDENQRGYLGISGATVDSTTAETYGIPSGIYVTKVYERSAAEEAGIITGDVVTKINGQSVQTISELQDVLAYYKGGEVITVTLQRASSAGYEELELQVTLSSKSIFN